MQYALIVITASLFAVTLIRPEYPNEQWLQHAPTVLLVPVLVVLARRRTLTTTSVFCIVAFWWLHIIGARYIYSNVPYDQWAQSLLGTTVSETFGWSRNHYDRLVHFCFGLLWMPPAVEIARVYGRLPRFWAISAAIGGVAAISAVYEIFEWLLAVVLSPETADAYNGQQGDMWDAQKDMALAMIGGLVALQFVFVRRVTPTGANLDAR